MRNWGQRDPDKGAPHSTRKKGVRLACMSIGGPTLNYLGLEIPVNTKFKSYQGHCYDGPSVKEKILKYFFHHRILRGKDIFKFIFTTVFLREKIYLNTFSPPYFWGRKYI